MQYRVTSGLLALAVIAALVGACAVPELRHAPLGVLQIDAVGIRVTAAGGRLVTVGGKRYLSEHWNKQHPPTWSMSCAEAAMLYTGDVNASGMLAYRCPEEVRLCDIRTGTVNHTLPYDALELKWANSGDELCFLTDFTERHARLIAFWDPRTGRCREYKTDLPDDATTVESIHSIHNDDFNRFSLSWSADDAWVLLSTRAYPYNKVGPKTWLIHPHAGVVAEAAVASAHFVDERRFVANAKGERGDLRVYAIEDQRIVEQQSLRRNLGSAMGVVAADPTTGWFVTSERPGPFEFKVHTWPVFFNRLDGERFPVAMRLDPLATARLVPEDRLLGWFPVLQELALEESAP